MSFTPGLQLNLAGMLSFSCELVLHAQKSGSRHRKHRAFIFMFLCCGVESVIVCETGGRTTGECAAGDEGRGSIAHGCAVNISR